MIEKITTWIKSQAIALVILGMMLVGGQTASFGASGDINTQPVWFVKGLTAGNPKVSVIDSSGNVVAPVAAVGAITSTGDGTIGGGTLTLTTSNTATSTATVGCIQSYATSTATAVRFVLSSAGTTTATYGGTNANGGVSWQYGTCPNL